MPSGPKHGSQAIDDKLDHLFRHESGRIVASLTRAFGPAHIDLAETVVQEALLKAIQLWPLEGVPENPSGWIRHVAKNQAIDLIRRERFYQLEPEVIESLSWEDPDPSLEGEIADDSLRLLFVCCHPVLPMEARIALTLKTVCGFGIGEIARGLLMREEAVAQRIVRAKQKIRDEKLSYEIPAGPELRERLDAVRDVLYLLFNEGYSAYEGETLIRRDLCEDAIRSVSAISAHPLLTRPDIHALLALMCLQASRFDARTDSQGEILLLEEQNRDRWDRALIERGLFALDRSAQGDELSRFHLEAGIAATHATAPSFEQTDWPRILAHYDLLLLVSPSPLLRLNRAVAMFWVKGADAAIAEIENLRAEPRLRDYHLLPATLAEMHRRSGNWVAALESFKAALDVAKNDTERKLIQRRILECQQQRM